MKSVVLFFRKPVPHFFSIEKIFSAIAEQLEEKVPVKKSFLPYHTSSISNVVKNFFFARKEKAEVYHITGDVHYLALALPKERVVLTIHDCIFLHQYSGMKKWFFHQLFLNWPVRHCKLVTTISEESKREIIQYSGCPPQKIRVINNPVSSTIYFREKKFDQEKPTLLFLGSTPNKNLMRVLDAINGVKCTLHIVGKIDDVQEEKLQSYQIEFIQSLSLSEKKLADAYCASDILMFPTLYEGFGLPILEAQKAGRVVLTSNLSPMKEVAGNGAHLCNPYQVSSIREGLLRLIEDMQYRDALIQKGFENVRGYGADHIAEQYLRLYEEVVAQATNCISGK